MNNSGPRIDPCGTPAVISLTHSCLEIYFTSVIWTCQTFKNKPWNEAKICKIFGGEL